MIELELSPITDRAYWNQLAGDQLGGDLLQSWEWGDFKEAYGWKASRYAWRDHTGDPLAAAQILQRSMRIPGFKSASLLYCPRGPSLDWENHDLRNLVLKDLSQLTADRQAIYMKIDPLVPFSSEGDRESRMPLCGEEVMHALHERNWKPSVDQVQFRNTMLLDLRPKEAQLLADMKQKTRYNIRLAGRSGVEVRQGDLTDLDLLYSMYAETSIRDGFVIRQPDYYASAWGSFIRAGMAQPMIAECEGQAIAAVIVYQFGKTAKYLYGMSRSVHREKMPNHLLQWEAIRWSKGRDCHTYDFWGAPEALKESDPLWGLYRFKRGFGAVFVESIGAWDFIHQPVLFRLYSQILPGVLGLMRARGRRRTSQTLE